MLIRLVSVVVLLIFSLFVFTGCSSGNDRRTNIVAETSNSGTTEVSLSTESKLKTENNSDIGQLLIIFGLKDIIPDISDDMISSMMFAKTKNLYVATYGYGKDEAWVNSEKPIYRIDSDGTFSLFAEIECGLLGILAVDGQENIYVSAAYNKDDEKVSDILKVSQDGKIIKFSSDFKQPCSGSFDTSGNLYLVDAQTNKVYKITPQGEKSVFLDISTSEFASGLLFHGMSFSKNFDSVYLAGYSSEIGKVLKCKINNEGKPETLDAICELPRPKLVYVDCNENVYVTCGYDQIARILPDGTKNIFSDEDIKYKNMLKDFSGNLYILGKECRIYKIN